MMQYSAVQVLTARRLWLATWALGLGMALGLLWPHPAQAQTVAQTVPQTPPPDTACKLCHIGNTDVYTLPSGETFPIGIDLETLVGSVHGSHAATDVYCTDCHGDRERYLYPHQPNPAHTYAEFQADVAQNCSQCHLPLDQHNPGHLLAEDATGLPTCTDCHGGHDVAAVDAMRADPVGTCQTCHVNYGEDVAVQRMHEQVVGSLGTQPDRAGNPATCQTCHGDQPAASADAACKTCHSLLDDALTLPSGEQIPLNVHADALLNSVHGPRTVQGVSYPALQCVDCHAAESYTFPHTPTTAQDARDYTLAQEAVCQDCHTDVFEHNQLSVHAIAQAEGNRNAATCVDCHGAHEIQTPDEPRERISSTCAQCHSAIHDQYATSVHGAALLGEQNPDVPVCTDCHTSHDIVDPNTARFRLLSPQLCAECHADETLMAQYGISTDVFDTYVADFHGTTVTIFEKTNPDQETNKAVCYDCHGAHNILASNDENSRIIKENLLATCQECHPDATANFPDTWTSHFKPSWEHNRIVYVINLFYQVLIPGVVGGMVLFIASDAARRGWDGYQAKRRTPKRKQDEDSAQSNVAQDDSAKDDSAKDDAA